MTTFLADIPIHLAPLDIVAFSGPVAVAMLLGQLAYYWRYGQAPGAIRARFTIALCLACLLVPASVIAMSYWHAFGLLIIGGILLFGVFSSYGRTTAPVSRATKLLCIGLRIGLILLLLLYLLRPTYRQVKIIYEKATLFVLYDGSKSMTIADSGGNGKASRFDAVRQAIEGNSRRIEALSELFDVKQYLFDDGLGQPIDKAVDLSGLPVGESTAIGKAIQQASQSVPGRKIAGVILITDGANNLAGPGTDPLQVAGSLGRQSIPVPVWPVGVGRETLTTDQPVVLARTISVPDRRVPAFNVLPVHAVFDFMNLGGKPVKLELVFGQGDQAKVVDTKVVTAAAGKDADTVAVDLQVTPTTTGFQAVTVRVADGEQVKGHALATQHSRITDYVQVVDDMMQVLYVEGKFRHEAHYLISALAASNLMRLNRQFLLTSAALDTSTSNQLPKAEAEWQRYHVIILGDIKADAFTAEQLRTIRTMVQDMGKGLLLLGGRDTFGQGGWPDSPLADVMPFNVRDASGQIGEPFKLTATPQGLTHQLMRLDDNPTRNSQLWNNMPTIQGANRFPAAPQITAARPGAIILATTNTGIPVMVAQQAGKGNVMAMAIDTTYRWRLHLPDGCELHNRFWRQAVMWLANRQGNCWVTTGQPRYRLSQVRQGTGGSSDREKIIAKAGLEDQTGKPVKDPKATLVELLPPDSQGKSDEIPIPLGESAYKKDHYELELPPPTRDGNYRLVFRGTLEGKEVHAETSFLVESTDIELSRPLANFDLLRQIGAAAGSATENFYTLDKLDELLGKFKSSDYLVKREDPRVTELGDKMRWPILWLIFAAFMAEWMIRKYRGLV